MHAQPLPPTGTIVTYLDPRTTHAEVLRRAVAVGPGLVDPHTNETWLPVRRPDRIVTLLDPALVVDVLPVAARADGAPAARSAGDVLDTLRRALGDAIRGVAGPKDGSSGGSQVRGLLADFLSSIAPVEATLRTLIELDPTGALAAAVTFLMNAAAHLDTGDIGAAREAIVTATIALDRAAPGLLDEADDSGYDDSLGAA